MHAELWKQLPGWACRMAPTMGGQWALISMQQPWLDVHAACSSALPQASVDQSSSQSRNCRPSRARCYSSQSKASKPVDWTQHTHTKFSIRPSLLSPLFSTYQSELKRYSRAKVITELLDAHSLLATEIDGIDSTQVERTAQHRASSLLQLSRDLRFLATRTNLPTCTQKGLMLGFYSLLDQELDAIQSGTDPSIAQSHGTEASGGRLLGLHKPEAGAGDVQVYHDVATGKLPVWDAWMTHFALRYQATPSLPPLELIYAQAHASKVPALSGAAHAGAQRASGQQGGVQDKIGARVDVTGTALAEGKRKTSVARVHLRAGSGRITVNDSAYDEYFKHLSQRLYMLQPLLLTSNTHAWDIQVQVQGAGRSSQAQAARTAIARALLLFKEQVPRAARHVLMRMARWDGRMVERKKPGKRKARASHAYVRR